MKKDILIVDDDRGICETLTDILEEDGFSVGFASTGARAIAMAAEGEYALALIDLGLPDTDGLNLMKELKKTHPDMGACIVTGNASKENAIEAIRYGAEDYFVKPLDLRDVVRRIGHTLEKFRLRRELVESNERYQRLFESGTEAIIVFDAETLSIEDANSGAVKLLGYGLEELLRLTPLDISGKRGDPGSVMRDFIKCPLESKELSTLEFVRKDGGIFPGEISAGSFNINGRRKIISSVRDVTLRKRADEALRQETKRAEMLLKISEAALNMTDMERLIGRVVTSMEEAGASDIILSYVWDRDGASGGGRFRPVEGRGFAASLNPFFRSELITGEVPFVRKTLDTGRVSLNNLSNDEFRLELSGSGLFSWLDEASTIAVIPLKEGRRYHGLIVCICTCRSPAPGSVCSSEMRGELLQAIANHVSTALEKACLYRDSINSSMELSRKIETIQTMSEISKSILSTHESEFILETTIRMITRLVACDRVRIVVVNRDKRELHFKVGFEGDVASHKKIVNFNDTNLTDVVITGLPQYISHLDALSSPCFIEEQLVRKGFSSVLRVPVIIKEEVFAVLAVMSRRSSAFTVEDRNVLEKLAFQIGIALENARLITDLEELLVNTVKTLAGTIEAKSRWTKGHSDRVTHLALEIGEALGVGEGELMDLKLAGLLHDIGKIGTYESILNKPEKLTPEEMAVVREHTNKGADILMPIKQLQRIIPAVRHHHEFFDGSGYPNGLMGDDIPVLARILTVADTVDAMGADRPYRRGLSMGVIIDELNRCRNTQFDPVVVDAFLKTRKSLNSDETQDRVAL